MTTLPKVPCNKRISMPAHALPFFASSVPDRGHVRDQVRFFVPGSCVSNLDFVESIFGNGDNPDLAENDAALDPGPPPFFLSSPFRAPSSVHQRLLARFKC